LDAGSSAGDIAWEWGCTPRSIRYVAKDAGLMLPQARRRLERLAPLSDRDWLRRELVERGRTVSEVAAELSVTTQGVRTAAAAAAVEIRRYDVPSPIRSSTTRGGSR
jgi:predicted transcriptional regulator